MTASLPLLEEVRRARRLLEPATARDIRVRNGLSQARLALEVGVDRTTLTRWESGASVPRGKQRDRYVEILSVLEQELAA